MKSFIDDNKSLTFEVDGTDVHYFKLKQFNKTEIDDIRKYVRKSVKDILGSNVNPTIYPGGSKNQEKVLKDVIKKKNA